MIKDTREFRRQLTSLDRGLSCQALIAMALGSS